MLKWLDGISRKIAVVELGVLALSLAAMIGFAFLQVVLRFLPGDITVHWLEPIARQLVLWVGLLGASLATADNRHISIEALPKILSPGQKQFVSTITNLTAATLASVLALLAWGWLVDVDRHDIAAAHTVSTQLNSYANKYESSPKEVAVKELAEFSQQRVNRLRIAGFARLIRAQQLTALRIEDLGPYDYPFARAAQALLKTMPQFKNASMEDKAKPETAEIIAAEFESLLIKSPASDEKVKTIFDRQPPDADVAAALGDTLTIAIFDVLKAAQSEQLALPTALKNQATRLTEIAEQKALTEIAGFKIHEWWFHVIVPLTLFVMAFRFLVHAYAAMTLSVRDFEHRSAEITDELGDLEFDDNDSDSSDSQQNNDASDDTKLDSETARHAAESQKLLNEISQSSQSSKQEDDATSDSDTDSDKQEEKSERSGPATERLKAGKGPLLLVDPDAEIPRGALETSDLPDSAALYDSVDKTPLTASVEFGLIDEVLNSDEELDEAVMHELGESDDGFTFEEHDEQRDSDQQVDDEDGVDQDDIDAELAALDRQTDAYAAAQDPDAQTAESDEDSKSKTDNSADEETQQ